jgi:hypothetical protein
MALLPQMVFFKRRVGNAQELTINLLSDAEADTQISGKALKVQMKADAERIAKSLTLTDAKKGKWPLQIRWPNWAVGPKPQNPAFVKVTDAQSNKQSPFGITEAQKLIVGTNTNMGRAALQHGPYVLAYDEKLNPNLPSARLVTLAPNAIAKPLGDNRFEVPIAFKDGTAKNAVFVPFADAGASGSRFAVWLRAPGNFPSDDALALGVESRSREGNVGGSILDGETGTFAVTFDNTRQEQDWFAVELEKPLTISRIVYAHGQNFHDGGWFDASGGKPQIQVKKAKDAAWETVGTLDEYPATTATDNKGLRAGQKFNFKLPAPLSIIAVRIIGKPSSGDNPNQAFTSCAELSALA